MSVKRKFSSDIEYLQPSIDHSNKLNPSPLELLAQTCSNIGQDSSSSLTLPNSDQSKRRSSSSFVNLPLKPTNVSPTSNGFSSFDPDCIYCQSLRYFFLSSLNQSNKHSYPINRFHPYFPSMNPFPIVDSHLSLSKSRRRLNSNAKYNN